MSAPLVVLCADDKRRRAWCEELGAYGWQVFAAREIQAAIDLAQQHQPQVIVTAVALPGASSAHFTRALRSVVEADVTIIGISEPAQLEAALGDGGFELVVTAPVDFESLHASIEASHEDEHEEKRTTTRMSRVPRIR
jgi:CheY-like chemotaxis protein